LRKTKGAPSCELGIEAEREAGVSSGLVGTSSQQPISSRPFIERRRSARIQSSWSEALDSLQRHLQGYESANKELLEAEETFRSIFEEAPIGIFQLSADGQPLRLNSEMARILGFDSAEDCAAAGPGDESLQFFHTSGIAERGGLIDQGGMENGIELQVRCRDGAVKWLRFNVRPVRINGVLVRYDGTAEDVTERKRSEIRTELLAYYDLLTGLPNRTLFHDRFNKAVANLRPVSGRVVVLLLEFDSFKTINDSLGRRFGDRLLQEIAERIRAGAGDGAIVARLGGAEFGVVLEDCRSLDEIVTAAEGIMARLKGEYSLLGHTLNVFCNMGISAFPANGEDYETLLKNADVAREFAKVDGANGFRIFSEEMSNEIQTRLEIERGLRQALKKEQLYLEYQPQVDIWTGEVAGLEALLRWNSPELGLVPPTKFIGIAENSSLIVPIGEWVLHAACLQARNWQDSGLPSVPIAVNVSPVQFRQQGFCDLVRRTLRDTGLRPECLELELTESLLMTNADLTASIIAELKSMGVMLAIDDFGTGYSSLGYLRHFKVHRLKIARSFIQDVSVDPDDAAITIAIIKMAKALNLAVLAEGVETKEQLRFLRAQNCQAIQGFYFSRPVGVAEVGRHLRTGFRSLLTPEET